MNSVNYFVLAENVITDKDQGATIVNIFNRMAVEKLPVVGPKIILAFGFYPPKGSLKSNDIKIKLQVLDPNNKVIADIKGTGTKVAPAEEADEGEPELAGSVDLSDGLVLKLEGTYTVKLFCGENEQLAENRFKVVKKGAKK